MNTPYALSLARIVMEALGESLSTKSPNKIQFHNLLINILVKSVFELSTENFFFKFKEKKSAE